MQPIFKEQIKMWKDNGYDIPIKEGMYWLNRGIIKAFTKDGVLHSLYKYKVNDDLTISITKHKNFCEDDFETWQETINRYKDRLDNLEQESILVVQQALKKYIDYDYWCLTSTGKDSVVTLHITQKVMPDVKVMFNNTSCDAADTYRIAKSHPDWIITNPEEGIYNYFERVNFIPTRFARACCSIYKEGASIDYFKDHNVDKLIQIMGVRNSESSTRADRQYVNYNPKWDNENWYGLIPIRKWDDIDVWLYILRENLEINPRYKKGYSRVGCAICCPYYTKSTWVLDKYWYLNLYNRWHKKLESNFLHNQCWQHLNCTLKEYHSCWNGGLLRTEPTDEVIQEMMQYKGLNYINIAKQYFNKSCCIDGSSIRKNDVLAMNMKMFGRNINKFLCKKCLMKEFNWSKEDWDSIVECFKSQGCKLF